LLDNNPELRERCKAGEVMFGTLDTWFLYKLTGGEHLTDSTNAAGSSLYNPFQLQWNSILCGVFDLPTNILPEVRDTNGDFGKTHKSLFGGAEIPIRAVVGDQSAALFGQCCFNVGDIKVSQGSGAFVNMLVGSEPKYSPRGLYPLIAWSLDGEITYMIEGSVQTAGTLIDWLGEGLGLSDTPQVLNELASRTEDTEGVIVIPTPLGVTFPYFEPRLRGSILGLSLSTKRRHVGRAVLEGIALRLIDIIEGIEEDTKIKVKDMKVDGGVSKSDIILQILADLADVTVKRAPESDMTSTGAAYIAGLAVGFWKDQKELMSFQKGYTEFTPKMDPAKRDMKIKRWKKAVQAIIDIA
jgi:glycerol kinase